nr:integrase, catalytic region, zinc finger, CCHC-type, peptidase aspartic, catalytic [Tanacetum cinerariifolium]
MTGNLKLLINFVWKFMGTVRFRNDHVAAIMGFGDLQWGNILITRVYFVEGLGHNLFYDKCLSKNVNGKNSCGKNQKAKVSVKKIQKKYQPKVAKPKMVETRERLATPKPRKPRFLLRWSPTGRLFDQEGKLTASRNLKLLINFVWKFMATVRFGNDRVAAILGFGDLQWGNILITRVYFVEGL